MKKYVLTFMMYISLLLLVACSGVEEINLFNDVVEEQLDGDQSDNRQTDGEQPDNRQPDGEQSDSKLIESSQPDNNQVKSEQPDIAQPGSEEPDNSTTDMGKLEVHYIDVGEADSALIICNGDAMLVDAGDTNQGTLIRSYLKKQNVNRLKYFLLTHSDKDHIGGAASVVSNVDIDSLFMCSYEKNNDIYKNLINEINYKNMTWSTPKPGDELQLGSAVITIVAPNREYDSPNNSSIALVVRHGENSFIFTGDAEAAAEADIIANGLDISADVYYVGHHGSSTSSTDAFLKKISPKYAVISCGKDNEYGHPHYETMDKLKAMNVKLFRTDDQGTIVASSDGQVISFNVEPSDNWMNGNPEYNKSASTQVKEALAKQDTVPDNTETTAEQNQTSESNASVVETPETVVDEQSADKDKSVEEPVAVSNEVTYVCNKNTKKFHIPTCDSVNEMKPKNRLPVTLSREEVISKGYVPCKRCNP